MQTSEQRDEKTVVVASALGLFCLVVAIGGVGLWAATSALGMSDATAATLEWVLFIAGGLLLVVYLVRARRR